MASEEEGDVKREPRSLISLIQDVMEGPLTDTMVQAAFDMVRTASALDDSCSKCLLLI